MNIFFKKKISNIYARVRCVCTSVLEYDATLLSPFEFFHRPAGAASKPGTTNHQ